MGYLMTEIVTVQSADEIAAALAAGAKNIRLSGTIRGPVTTGVRGIRYSGGAVAIPPGAVTVWTNNAADCTFANIDISGGNVGLLSTGNNTTVVGCRIHDIQWRGGRSPGAGIELHGNGCSILESDFIDIGSPGATEYHAIRTAHPVKLSFNRFQRIAGRLIILPDGASGDGAVITDAESWPSSELRLVESDEPLRLRLVVDGGAAGVLERPGPDNETIFACMRAVLHGLEPRAFSYDAPYVSFTVARPICTRFAISLPDMDTWACSYPLGVPADDVRATLKMIQATAKAVNSRIF